MLSAKREYLERGEGWETSVLLGFEITGVHQHPHAPPNHEYLRKKHRHNFRVRLRIPVAGTVQDWDLDAAAVPLLLQMETLFPPFAAVNAPTTLVDFGELCCDELAVVVANLCIKQLGRIPEWVEVDEGDSQGARVTC